MSSGEIELARVACTDPRHVQALALRYELLRRPLGMPPGSEVFDLEDDCLHFVAERGGRVVGTAMFWPRDPKAGRLMQMAVRAELHGQGIGRQVVGFLEREVLALGYEHVFLHARAPVVGFYERLGYEVDGEPFVEVGIPHRLMRKSLPAAPSSRASG